MSLLRRWCPFPNRGVPHRDPPCSPTGRGWQLLWECWHTCGLPVGWGLCSQHHPLRDCEHRKQVAPGQHNPGVCVHEALIQRCQGGCSPSSLLSVCAGRCGSSQHPGTGPWVMGSMDFLCHFADCRVYLLVVIGDGGRQIWLEHGCRSKKGQVWQEGEQVELSAGDIVCWSRPGWERAWVLEKVTSPPLQGASVTPTSRLHPIITRHGRKRAVSL